MVRRWSSESSETGKSSNRAGRPFNLQAAQRINAREWDEARGRPAWVTLKKEIGRLGRSRYSTCICRYLLSDSLSCRSGYMYLAMSAPAVDNWSTRLVPSPLQASQCSAPRYPLEAYVCQAQAGFKGTIEGQNEEEAVCRLLAASSTSPCKSCGVGL